MIDVRELGGLLQRAGLALPVADLDRTMVRYADAVALIHEIRELGLSNNLVGRSRTPVSRRLMGGCGQPLSAEFRRCRRPHARHGGNGLAHRLGPA